jgi:CysZ protein
MIIPGILSLGYICLLVMTGLSFFPEMSAYLYERLPGVMQWQFLQGVITMVLWLLLMLTGYVTYQPVILIIFSPALSCISEIVESKIYGVSSPPFNLKVLIHDLIRSLMINARNLLKMMGLTLLAWMFLIIPFMGGGISAVIIFFIQSYYNGFTLTDYTLERKRYSVKESIQFIQTHRARISGVGAGFMLMFLIPVIGWFTAPAYGTVAATLSALDAIREDLQI